MRSNRWFLYGPFLLAAVVLAVWWGLWREGAKVMRAEMANFAVAQQANGASVSHGPLRTKGFPFYLRGVFTDFDYSAPDLSFSYSAEQVFVDALPYALDRLIFSSWGEQRLVVGEETFAIEESNLKTSIGDDAARGWFFKAESDAVKLRSERSAAEFSLQKLLLNAAPATDDPMKTEASAVVNQLLLAQPETAIEIDELRFFGVADEDNNIEIRMFEIEVGESLLSVQGEISLDLNRRLSGVLNGEIKQPIIFAKWLGNAVGLPSDQAQALEGAAALLAFNGNKISVEFRDGRTTIAGVDIGPAPRL